MTIDKVNLNGTNIHYDSRGVKFNTDDGNGFTLTWEEWDLLTAYVTAGEKYTNKV